MDYIRSCGSICKGPHSPATHCVHLQCVQKSYLISLFYSHSVCYMHYDLWWLLLWKFLIVISFSSSFHYWGSGPWRDTWSLTSIPLHADATKSITAKIHLSLLTKLRHTASSLYMFVLSRHNITPFNNCWATSRSGDSVLNRVHTRTFCRWVFERPVRSWRSCVTDTFLICCFNNPIRNSQQFDKLVRWMNMRVLSSKPIGIIRVYYFPCISLNILHIEEWLK